MPVIWRSLELEGFGRYRDRARVEFDSGLNTVVAENESGKSTLVAGLSSVLFGLPRTGSAGGSGAARYLNWDKPGRFAGIVEFDAAGDRYRVRRDFADNRVWLEARQESGEWLVHVQGEHNPQAHKRNERYEEAISSLLGVTSRELFWRTFCITQPLPEEKKLDHSVQRLLSGAGGDLKAALQSLFDRLREITKSNMEFGAGSADGKANKPLDDERERVVALGKMIDESAGALDRLYAEDAELAQVEDRKRQTQAALQQKEAAASAFAEWRRLRDLYASEVRQKAEIEKALASLDERQKAHEALYGEIDRQYRPFVDAGVGERLGELSNLEARLAERAAQVADLQGQISMLESESQLLEARLREDYASVRGRQYLVVQVRALQRLSQERAEVRRQMAACVKEMQEAQGALAALPAWGLLGGSPVQALAYIRTQAGDFRRAWDRLTAIGAAIDEVRLKMQREYSAFERADPATRDALSRYDTRLERLEREIEARQSELDRAMSLVDSHASDEARARKDFSDIADLGDAFAEAAQTKIGLLRESFELLRDAGSEDHGSQAPEPLSLARRVAAMLLFGIGGFVLAWSLLGSPSSGPAVIVSAAVGLIGAVLGWGIGAALPALRRPTLGHPGLGRPALGRSAPTTRPRQDRLAVIQQEITGLAPSLGDFARADQATLAAILERIRARDARRTELEAAKRSLPQRDAVGALATRLDSARTELAEFRNLTRPFSDRAGNVAEAFAAWRAAKVEERGLTTQFGEALAALAPDAHATHGPGGLHGWLMDLPVDAITALAGTLTLARLMGSQPSTAGGLAAWLTGRDDAWWDEVLSGAARFEELTRRVATTSRASEDLTGREERLGPEVQDLLRDVKPFDDNTDVDELDALWTAARTADKQRERVAAALEALLQRLEPLEQDRQRLQNAAASLRSQLQEPLDSARGSTAQAAELWAECQDLIARASGMRSEVEGILQGQQSRTPDALRQRATDIQLRALNALNKWQSYAASHPGLPPAEIAFDIEALTSLQEQRQQEVQELRSVLAEAAREVDVLRDRLAQTKAAQVVNVATLAEALAEHRRLVAELEVEAKSLGIAHTELDAARRDYQAKYRDLLSSRATERFRELSGIMSRAVLFGEDFEAGVTSDGRPVAIEQLSQGARDQLYLAVRLALADLLARDVELPFIFDDPFLTCDEQRTERIRVTLLTIAASRQIIVLSHRNEIASWGKRVEVKSVLQS